MKDPAGGMGARRDGPPTSVAARQGTFFAAVIDLAAGCC
jgi:hypothetical protein